MTKKQVPYVTIEGIPNDIADAALLSVFSLDSFKTVLQGENIVMAKAKLNSVKLRKKQYDKKVLIKSLAPLLQKEYSIYNYFAQVPLSMDSTLIDKAELEGIVTEEWIESLQEGIEEDPFYLFAVFNELRFQHSESLHRLAKPLLEYYADVFEENTGFELGTDFERKDVVMKKKKDRLDNGAGIGDKFKKVQELLSEIEEFTKLYDEQEIASLKSELDESVAKAEKLEKEQAILQAKFNAAIGKLDKTEELLSKLRSDFKAKESSLVSITKKHNELVKSYSTLEAQNDQLKKEGGKTGQAVGELRKKVEELEAENNQFSKKIKVLEADKAETLESYKNSLESQWRSQMALLKDQYETKLSQLENELERKDNIIQEREELHQSLQEKNVVLEEKLKELESRVDSDAQTKETGSNGISDPVIAELVNELVRKVQSSKIAPNQEPALSPSHAKEESAKLEDEQGEEDGFSFLKDLIDIKPV